MNSSNRSSAVFGNETDPAFVLKQLIDLLSPLALTDQRRVLRSVALFLDHPDAPPAVHEGTAAKSNYVVDPAPFGAAAEVSPKQFMLEKMPKTDVERIACLAYYLTNYRSTPHFKTLDLSKLNTEAAQPKFTNAANAANNAMKLGYLVQAVKGARQISAFGEQFVNALPERTAAREVMVSARRHRKPIRKSK